MSTPSTLLAGTQRDLPYSGWVVSLGGASGAVREAAPGTHPAEKVGDDPEAPGSQSLGVTAQK